MKQDDKIKMLRMKLDISLEAVKECERMATKDMLNWIEAQARAYMRQYPDLLEFVMAMGMVDFTYAQQPDDTPDELYRGPAQENEGDERVRDFLLAIGEHHGQGLHITGYPMRFTAEGEVRNDW